jgi:hypothetical protein
MNRRDYLKKMGLLSSLPLIGGYKDIANGNNQSIYELRKYRFISEKYKSQFNTYLSNIYIPALNQLGIKPVGSFRPIYLFDSYIELYLLLTFSNIEEAFLLNKNLFDNKEFSKKTDEFDFSTNDNPLYISYDSTILLAFSNFPKIVLPDICINKQKRYFNLRIYKSHSNTLLQKKIDMFNVDGEIELHESMGYQHIFFGEAIFGDQMPNMSYMHVWSDLKTYEDQMDKFWNNPEFVKLRNNPKYNDSTYDSFSILLIPENCSQI